VVIVFAVPGDLSTPTGGYVYDRRIVAELRALGRRVDVLDLGNGFPRSSAEMKAAASAQLAGVPCGATVVVDGLALGVLPEAAEALQRNGRLVALVHHPLAYETGLDPDEAASLKDSERAALSFARRVVTTSQSTAKLLIGEYGVPKDRLTAVCPGTDRATIRPREARGGTIELLAVGSIVPRKGYDILIAALARLADLDWRLLVAGDRDRDSACARALDAAIARLGLGDRITMLGAVSSERLATHYAEADLFVLPSRFEGFGMAYTEAIAHGLPVVGTTAGAIPEAVPAQTGVLVPPDNIDALAETLRQLLTQPSERARLAAGAQAAAAALTTWPEAGMRFAQVLDDIQ
jgi:glycosyltransferase involved in cell wall biosynthesis